MRRHLGASRRTAATVVVPASARVIVAVTGQMFGNANLDVVSHVVRRQRRKHVAALDANALILAGSDPQRASYRAPGTGSLTCTASNSRSPSSRFRSGGAPPVALDEAEVGGARCCLRLREKRDELILRHVTLRRMFRPREPLCELGADDLRAAAAFRHVRQRREALEDLALRAEPVEAAPRR